MKWIEPVPWDCACFLNITTSLCDRYPVAEFRYAFDGTGNFPSAVFLSSDGVDDSFITAENLTRFYNQTLDIFVNSNNLSQTVNDLEEHLSKISKKGSHDDMSISALINMDEVRCALQLSKLTSEGQALKQSKTEKVAEINDLKLELEELKSKKEQLKTFLKKESDDYNRWMIRFIERLRQADEELSRINLEISNKETSLQNKETELIDWEPNSKKRYDEICSERIDILNTIKEHDANAKETYLKNREMLKKENRESSIDTDIYNFYKSKSEKNREINSSNSNDGQTANTEQAMESPQHLERVFIVTEDGKCEIIQNK
jgi:chromosome segregation ATPase